MKRAEALREKDEQSHEAARQRLIQMISQLSRAQDTAARADDVAAALRLLTSVVRNGPERELAERLAAGRNTLTERRARLTKLGDAVLTGRELAAAREELQSEERIAQQTALRASLDVARSRKLRAEKDLASARAKLESEEALNAVARSLSLLVEHGQGLGLHEGHCPLCAAARTDVEFAAGIQIARNRIASLASNVLGARDAVRVAEDALARAREALNGIEQQVAAGLAQEQDLAERNKIYTQSLSGLGLAARLADHPEELAGGGWASTTPSERKVRRSPEEIWMTDSA